MTKFPKLDNSVSSESTRDPISGSNYCGKRPMPTSSAHTCAPSLTPHRNLNMLVVNKVKKCAQAFFLLLSVSSCHLLCGVMAALCPLVKSKNIKKKTKDKEIHLVLVRSVTGDESWSFKKPKSFPVSSTSCVPKPRLCFCCRAPYHEGHGFHEPQTKHFLL